MTMTNVWTIRTLLLVEPGMKPQLPFQDIDSGNHYAVIKLTKKRELTSYPRQVIALAFLRKQDNLLCGWLHGKGDITKTKLTKCGDGTPPVQEDRRHGGRLGHPTWTTERMLVSWNQNHHRTSRVLGSRWCLDYKFEAIMDINDNGDI